MIRTLVTGALGRTGKLIADGILKQKDIQLVGCLERQDHPKIGTLLAGEVMVYGVDQIDAAIKETCPEVIVDFTSPQATLELIKKVIDTGTRFVIGTTGFSQSQGNMLRSYITENNSSAVISSNFSITGNALFYIGELLGKMLQGKAYDFEIIEMHDRIKRDSPSGTALELGECVAKAMGNELDGVAHYGRKRQACSEERNSSDIYFHSLRAGGPGAYIAENSLIAAGPWDRIEIIDRLYGMEGIVDGCMDAIRFVANSAESGHVYDMLDVLKKSIQGL